MSDGLNTKSFALLLLLAGCAASGDPDGDRSRSLPPPGATRAPRNEELRREILRMRDADQEARREILDGNRAPKDYARIRELDRRNTARMKEIIAEHGWPGRSLVGTDGTSAAWLLVQHATHDPAFQHRALDLLEVAVDRREASPADLAYLTDRVRVNAGEPQLYGTQFRRDEEGKLVPEPIEDEAALDERRSRVGLPPMAEYTEAMRELYPDSSNGGGDGNGGG